MAKGEEIKVYSWNFELKKLEYTSSYIDEGNVPYNKLMFVDSEIEKQRDIEFTQLKQNVFNSFAISILFHHKLPDFARDYADKDYLPELCLDGKTISKLNMSVMVGDLIRIFNKEEPSDHFDLVKDLSWRYGLQFVF
jgi:hypothetical protein